MMDGNGAQNQDTTKGTGLPPIQDGSRHLFRGDRSRFALWLMQVLRCIFLLIFLVAFAIVIFRDGRSFLVRRPTFAVDWMGLAMFALSLGMEISIMLWFFSLGCCIGSFLNVVVYRVPLNRTLWGSSHCPYCQHAIRSWDNIPLVGWLNLRGRCRDCRKTIATRYAQIELLMGCLFLVLAMAELGFPYVVFHPIANRFSMGLVKVLLEPDLVQWSRFLVHIVLTATLVAAWQMSFDGHTLPWKFLRTSWLMQLVPCTILPWIATCYWEPIWHVGSFPLARMLEDSANPFNDMILALRNVLWIGGIGSSSCALIYGISNRKQGPSHRAQLGVLAGLVGWTLGITWGIPCVCLTLLAPRFASHRDVLRELVGIDEHSRGRDTVFLKYLLVFSFLALLFASQSGSLDAQILSFLIGQDE